MPDASPTIKGIFVMSHVRALEQEMGTDARAELEKRFGRAINFKNNEDVPVRDEITIIEHAFDIQNRGNAPVDAHDRAVEAGKLHFRNFSGTPLGKLVLPVFRSQFKMLLMQANNIAGHVFRGVQFKSTDAGPTMVKIEMTNNDYPIGHFQGFFQEWATYSGFTGSVESEDLGSGRYVYTVHW